MNTIQFGSYNTVTKQSSEGYIENNVQWVHKHVNRMKSDKSDDEFLEWCKKCYLHNL